MQVAHPEVSLAALPAQGCVVVQLLPCAHVLNDVSQPVIYYTLSSCSAIGIETHVCQQASCVRAADAAAGLQTRGEPLLELL